MQTPAPSRSRSRVAALRLPPDLPPRDLEHLASSAAAAPYAPHSAGAKFGGEGSPADVRVYSPAVAPLLMRGGVVSPGCGTASGLVLPNLSLQMNSQAPVSVALSNIHTASSLPVSPVTAPTLTQNEIKKAQNRKSAKRFREAQKQRWKNMADELLIQKKTIDDLRAQIAANQHVQSPAKQEKRSAMSINDLVDRELPVSSPLTPPPPSHAHVEAEAALYAQILSSTAPSPTAPSPTSSTPALPYVSELGLLSLCYVVVKATGRVVSIRRGSPNRFATFAVDGLSQKDAVEFRNALSCGKPVAVGYVRHGSRVNAVMKPIDDSDRVLVAEFSPLN